MLSDWINQSPLHNDLLKTLPKNKPFYTTDIEIYGQSPVSVRNVIEVE